MRVLGPGELWITLAEHLGLPDLVAAADAFVADRRPGGPLCSVADLSGALEAHPRARGRARLRDAVALARTGASSRPESLLRVLLGGAGVPEPELNLRLPGLPFLVDLAWPESRFGIEYDGAHHRSARQFSADIDRQELIHDSGWLLMRVQKDQLFGDPHGVVRRVRRRLADRGLVVREVPLSQSVIPRR